MFIASKKRVLFALLSIFCLCGFFRISAKTKEKDENTAGVYKKYIHPREYVFDLSDAKSKIVLKLDEENGKAYCNVDFTYLVEDEMPRKGDKITFTYEGTASKDVQSITATIYDLKKGKNIGAKVPEIFTTAVTKKQTFKKTFSQILNEDAESSISLRLIATLPEEKKKADKIELTFKRVTESTNIKKELEAEKKAIANGSKIVRVKSNYTVIENKAAVASEESETIVEQEVITAENQVVMQKETLPVKDEKVEEQKIVIKVEPVVVPEPEKPVVVETSKKEQSTYEPIVVKNKVSQYKKEYLQDYAVSEELETIAPDVVEEKKIENPDKKDKNGRTLLMLAAKNGNKEDIKKLIASDADVNLKDNEGWTALMYAVRYQKDLSCVDLIIDSGADIKASNKYGLSALVFAACYNQNHQILSRLIKSYSPSDKEVLKSFVLMLSESTNTANSQYEKTKVFVNYAVPVNAFYEGKTPLMYAAQYCSTTKILRLLLENNAQTGVRSTEGKTAYDYAVLNPNLEHDNVYWALNKK